MCCDQFVAIGSNGSPEPLSFAELGQLAVELAVGAGQVAKQGRARGFRVDTKSSATDLVTEVDRRVERWLGAAIADARPEDGVLGEEGGERRGSSGVRWVLDPIDGTVNFAIGLPWYAVSVAVEVSGQVVAGCVHNPESGDTYHAVAGGGAFRNRAESGDVRLTGPRDAPVERMVVATGFGYDADRRRQQASALPELLSRIGDIRRFGAASLDLCAVASGLVDGYFELGLNYWDYAAGLLIAHEAGCASSDLGRRGAGSEFIAVCRPTVAVEFFRVLSDCEVDLPRS